MFDVYICHRRCFVSFVHFELSFARKKILCMIIVSRLCKVHHHFKENFIIPIGCYNKAYISVGPQHVAMHRHTDRIIARQRHKTMMVRIFNARTKKNTKMLLLVLFVLVVVLKQHDDSLKLLIFIRCTSIPVKWTCFLLFLGNSIKEI